VVSVLTWKLRITVLWIVLAFCNPVGILLAMFEPGVIRGLMAGEWYGLDAHDSGVQIYWAISWLGSLAMAFLTLVLKDAVNRWTNGLLGVAIAVDMISRLGSQLGGRFGGTDVVVLVAALVPLLIVWHAWKWPRPNEVTSPRQRQETALH
jgi:hypothetical protein